MRPGALGETDAVAQMPGGGFLVLAGLGEPVTRVDRDRLQQPVARTPRSLGADRQRALYEQAQGVQDVRG